MKHVLAVDDEQGPRESLKAILSTAYRVSLASSADQAASILADQSVDVLLLDVVMPEKSGLELLREVRRLCPSMPVVMISASSSVKPVVEAMRMGAYDYIAKPYEVEDILGTVRRALESRRLSRRVANLENDLAREFPVGEIVGDAPSFRLAMADLEKAAATDATVLIQGESGTGKELAARMIHARSERREEPFVAVHCAALSETLMESELFGHEKGAFTSADRQKPGRFDLAGSGTLFFDELGEMTLGTQVKLLRVLQEHEFMRVGGTRVIRTDARIVAATSRNLRQEVKEGRFRDDLFYRISVVPVCLPPLRERREDIPLLTRFFLDTFRTKMNVACEALASDALDLFNRYDWPGNIRELRNIIERMAVLHGRERMVLAEFLPDEFHRPPPPAAVLPSSSSLRDAVDTFERQMIERALRDAGGVRTRAAELLGTTRRVLAYRIERLQIGTPGP